MEASAVPLRLAIVMPVLNEAAGIDAALLALQPLRARGAHLIVVDGGSDDDTAARARAQADLAVQSDRGRARQMNAGAARAVDADVLLFLHADTRLPRDADLLIAHALARGARWGRFDVRIDGHSPWLVLVAHLMNLRSRLTGICTGDQALFVETGLFRTLHGYADIPLMEDVELSRRARAITRPAAIATSVVTSGRRWEQRGIWRTITQMWSLRWRYWRGADPTVLARDYREVR
ncbi:MAG TPA: TIGR04283 family arsenosugar biosynthesis glycosyltransferase [Burkholderiaceae bacterium]|nr:TIGR04283 family arsenosugar biosynthesis glycosyltransferase [Burkholderiaceae bacterium]HQR70882.1 TIGR04283 family arsenosugar biosynthesis glycosyltransferase [Burkholderiaceae bacterium]